MISKRQESYIHEQLSKKVNERNLKANEERKKFEDIYLEYWAKKHNFDIEDLKSEERRCFTRYAPDYALKKMGGWLSESEVETEIKMIKKEGVFTDKQLAKLKSIFSSSSCRSCSYDREVVDNYIVRCESNPSKEKIEDIDAFIKSVKIS